jgi:DNA-binding MarR family transcriptional regulator
LASECFVNLIRTGQLLIDLHNRQTRADYQLSASAREALAVLEGAGEPLAPSVIAERLLITTGTMTSLLDTLERRGLVRRMSHAGDRRKLLVDVTAAGQAIIDELLPSLHARERDVIFAALTNSEQRELLQLLAKLQEAATNASSTPPLRDATRNRPDRAVEKGSSK